MIPWTPERRALWGVASFKQAQALLSTPPGEYNYGRAKLGGHETLAGDDAAHRRGAFTVHLDSPSVRAWLMERGWGIETFKSPRRKLTPEERASFTSTDSPLLAGLREKLARWKTRTPKDDIPIRDELALTLHYLHRQFPENKETFCLLLGINTRRFERLSEKGRKLEKQTVAEKTKKGRVNYHTHGDTNAELRFRSGEGYWWKYFREQRAREDSLDRKPSLVLARIRQPSKQKEV